MSDRPTLRFLSGDRAEEVVPLSGPTFTVGRRPGNSLQIADPSVSGRHAELTLDDLGLVVQDLGSTNGTRVDGERVVEERVQPGAVLRFGNIELRFEDGSEPPLAAAPAAPLAAGQALELEEPEAAGSIDADKLAASRRGSRALPLVILVLGLGAAAAWWFLRGEGSDGGGGAAAEGRTEVTPPSGELLLASYSFEADAGEWGPLDDAPRVFDTARSARRSGAVGLAAELAAGTGVQVHASPLVRVSEGRFQASVAWRAGEGSARVRLATELLSTREDGPRPLILRTAWRSPGEEWSEELMPLEVPPGYDRARVLLEAEAIGLATAGVNEAGNAEGVAVVHADDASLVPMGRSAPVLELGTRTLLASGDPTAHLSLVDVQRLLLPSIRRTDEGPFEVTSDPRGARLKAAGAGRWSVRTASAGADSGLRTLGEGGSSSHPAAFERSAVHTLLIGSGRELVALRCDGGAVVVGRPLAGGGWDLELDLPASGALVVQVAFQQELSEALQLASAARKATREGRVGEALQAWQSLLDSAPYDQEVTAEAEAALAALAQEARVELGALEETIARARFFRLTDGYRDAIASADALAQRYGGTEIAEQARSLIAPTEAELDALELGREEDELARLEAIRLALIGQGQALLADAVQGLLNQKQGGGR
jgi:hypothetical protein